MEELTLAMANPYQQHAQALERIDIVAGDITTLRVDAIVNAANESLLGGGGVDGAIHRAAGPELKQFNQTLGGCDTGNAKVSPAFNLQQHGIKHIIHTVGPVWHAGAEGEMVKLGDLREDVMLASCYMRSLEQASRLECQSVAFPAISTGAYGFPKQRGAKIAMSHVLDYLKDREPPDTVIFCCFAEADAAVYHEVIETRDQWMGNPKRG